MQILAPFVITQLVTPCGIIYCIHIFDEHNVLCLSHYLPEATIEVLTLLVKLALQVAKS